MALEVRSGGAVFRFNNSADPNCEFRQQIPARDPIVIAGPALITLSTFGPRSGYCTVRLTPDSYPPDKALLVPPGTNLVSVALECSTNLVQWTAATNGVYGSPTEAKFSYSRRALLFFVCS